MPARGQWLGACVFLKKSGTLVGKAVGAPGKASMPRAKQSNADGEEATLDLRLGGCFSRNSHGGPCLCADDLIDL